MKIQVTQEHIDKGRVNCTDNFINVSQVCPIALALRDVFKTAFSQATTRILLK